MKETVGAVAHELQKQEAPTRDPIELEREMHKDYERRIYESIADGKKSYTGDFYIVVMTKREMLLTNVLRNYFVVRQTAPTPNWEQTVYKYHREEERIEFLWVVPDKDACEELCDNALLVHPDEKQLLHFVLQLFDGSLLQYAKRLNGEQESSLLLS